MATTILPDLSNVNAYSTFLTDFRADWVQNEDTAEDIIVAYKNKRFRYRNSDLYLVAIENAPGQGFTDLGEDENYNQMAGSTAKISLSSLKNSLDADFSQGFHAWSAAARQIILLTAEAAKSHTVAYLVKKILQCRISPRWSDLKELLTNWDKTRAAVLKAVTDPLVYEDYVAAGEADLSVVKTYLPVP